MIPAQLYLRGFRSRPERLGDRLDAMCAEGLVNGGERGSSDHELSAGLRLELAADEQRAVFDLGDSLALEGLDQVRGKLRIGRQLLADLLEQFLDHLDVG